MAFIRLTAAAIGFALPLALATSAQASHGHPGRLVTANYRWHKDKLGATLPRSYRSTAPRPLHAHAARS